jgi:hypothetical protein
VLARTGILAVKARAVTKARQAEVPAAARTGGGVF